jgi:hypothetical protein
MDISRLIGGQGVLRVATILIVTVSACLPRAERMRKAPATFFQRFVE